MIKIVKEIMITGVYIVIALIVSLLVVRFVGVRTEVNGDSMNDTLYDGENLIVDKITYRFKDPERYDIVVFPYRFAEDTFYIKRLIGMPGETIYIDEAGNIYINDELLKESYGREIIINQGRAAQPVHLGDDEYFVMGDNRNNSSDSRDPAVGNILRGDIIGKAWLRFWPFSEFGFLKHQA